MPRHIFPKPYADVVARLRVPGGFVLVAAFAWFSAPTPASLAVGIPVSALGLLIRAWAAGHLAKNTKLATTGPYAFVRNPLYIGTLLVAAGLVIAARQWSLALLFAAVFFGIYLPVIELEEQHLRKLFPRYTEYAKRVPMLAPRLRPVAAVRGWDAALYMRNEEWQAALGYLAGLALLLWKAFSRGT